MHTAANAEPADQHGWTRFVDGSYRQETDEFGKTLYDHTASPVRVIVERVARMVIIPLIPLVALVAGAHGVRAQADSSTLLQHLGALDAKQIAAVERGEPVTITLDTPEKTEVATLGVVKLDVPRAFFVDHVRELTGFLASGMQSSAGMFNEPARLEDMADLALDASDARALEKCRSLSCDVKLPAGAMESFRARLGKRNDPSLAADSLMREWIVDYVNAYRADSAARLVEYDDTKRSVSGSEAFLRLLAERMPAGIDSQPFAQMLAVPRSARPPGVLSRISWEIDLPSGLKPTFEVLERSMYATPSHPNATFMATKQLYASHYFEAQIDFIVAADGRSASGKPETYLIILRRQKFDDLPSGGLFNIRGRAVKKLRNGLRATLAHTRTLLSSAFAAR